MNLKGRFLLLLLFAVAKLTTQAQQTGIAQKPPLLQSFWGVYKGGNHPVNIVLSMVDTSIWVIDDKKVKYSIRSFRVNYFSFDSYEDEETGKIKTRRNLLSREFKETDMLSDMWKQKLFEEIKPKDEILIDMISVRDKQGHIFYAPEIRITIQ